ncbi:TauD/TfdA family dioxygenase [Streptomyces sp. NPDC058611]|uniref:TauD/TfdA family dioxygenase n=1 Tax=unclassified Streptomyces TaxID=2593676 RepID=UPI00364698FD
MPEAGWKAYGSGPRVREEVLESVARLGFALLRGVPTRDRAVLDVARTFGFVRETNYGRLFEVRVEAAPTDLAFTGAGIAPHTDNPYRDPVPTLHLLHCLNGAPGGDSGLVDGFHAAALLRAEDPHAFAVLARTPVEFVFADAHTELRAELRAERPLIDVDPLGRIREIRFNNRSIGTLHGPADEVDASTRVVRSTRPCPAASARPARRPLGDAPLRPGAGGAGSGGGAWFTCPACHGRRGGRERGRGG